MIGLVHHWRCGSFEFKQRSPLVMGILNVTPDSFSDGGRYVETSEALSHAYTLLKDGADIIDIGGESTRPGSEELQPDQELQRVLPLVRTLAQDGVCVSIDSRHPEVVKACLDEGASIINDITGFTAAQMRELAAESDAGCVIMHMKGEPQTMQEHPHYDDVVEEVSSFLTDRARMLLDNGVTHERICIDPGPGFGKAHEHNLAILRSTFSFSHLGSPPYLLMAAWSRKRFIGELTREKEAAQRIIGSVTAAVFSATQGAGVLRVHDVKQTVEALRVLEAIYD